MNLWTKTWTKSLVRSLEDGDDAPRRVEGGWGGRRQDRTGGDRLHRVLFRAKRCRLARAVRRDVLRGRQTPLSRTRLRGAQGGGPRLHARGPRKDEPIDERGDEAHATGGAGGDLATD